MKLSSQNLFKGTVFLLGIPAVLFLPVATLAIVFRLVWHSAGISSFTFAVTQRELAMIAALLGIFVLAIVGVLLFYRQSRRRANINR